ncbi:MAG: hypothetical protein OQK82_00365 [Candidatus Pacearchaeota archaeon]|nr:hypothetical protein [Candidatus Pacearchaeota archaeon]
MVGLVRNRRGDIPITILVIGIFGVCVLAVISFIYSNIALRNDLVGIDVIENLNNQIEYLEFQKESVALPVQKVNKRKYLPFTKDELLFSVRYESP